MAAVRVARYVLFGPEKNSDFRDLIGRTIELQFKI